MENSYGMPGDEYEEYGADNYNRIPIPAPTPTPSGPRLSANDLAKAKSRTAYQKLIDDEAAKNRRDDRRRDEDEAIRLKDERDSRERQDYLQRRYDAMAADPNESWGKGPDWVRPTAAAKNTETKNTKTKTTKTTTATTEPPTRTGAAPSGFNQENWANTDVVTAKYDAAAFLSGLTRPSDVAAMVASPAFQKRFQGATFDGKDRIDFKNNEQDGVLIGIVDVLRGADKAADTSQGMWWGYGVGQAPPGDPGGGDPGGGDPGVGDPGGGDPGGGYPGGGYPYGVGPGGSGLFNPRAVAGPPTLGATGYGSGTMGSMITPYNPLATYSPETYVPPDQFRPPAYTAATPFERDPYASATPFEAPTAADMAADPSYQFRLQQGLDALERSGAARGISRTGATMKALFDYGANSASQEYASVDARKRDTYDTAERNRFNAYQANYGNALQSYGMNEGLRSGAFDTNVGNARDAYGTNEDNRYKAYVTNQTARRDQNQTAENRRLGAYNTNLGAYTGQQNFGLRAQDQAFNQAYRNWSEQWNQGRNNAQDQFNRQLGLATAT